MKIVIIGTRRSRSTLLLEMINLQYPNYECFREHYTRQFNKNNLDVPNITEYLMSKDNYTVKVLANNFLKNYTISDYQILNYDKIYLIERYDFFDQCLSLEVASKTGIWALRKQSTLLHYFNIKKQKFLLTIETVLALSEEIKKYIEVKNYLNNNQKNYELYSYESLKNHNVPKIILDNPNLNYPSMFLNYNLKEQVNNIFNKFFNFQENTSNIEDFRTQILEIKNLFSEQCSK